MNMAPWQKAILREGELYLVGGVVRDRLMGLGDGGVDRDYLVRRVKPQRLEEILGEHGHVVRVGRSFGVYKFTASGEQRSCDLAFPRTEQSTGSGHREFDVQADPELPVENDLSRRDFTINAIAERLPGGEIIDPCGGAADIEARVLRMIFARAFEEDPLRILRGARFSARFGLSIDPDTWRAMSSSAHLVSSVSPERVQEELDRLLTECVKPSEGLELLRRAGALRVILPELQRAVGVEQNEHHPDDVYWHALKSCDRAPRTNLLVRWSALLHDLGKVDAKQTVEKGGQCRVVFYGHEDIGADITEAVLTRLRYPGRFVTRCRGLVQHHMIGYDSTWSRSAVRRFIRRVGRTNLDAILELKRADVLSRGLVERVAEVDELAGRIRVELEGDSAVAVTDLAVDGGDVIREMEVSPGPAVGRVLNELLEAVIERPELNERQRLIEWLRSRREGKRES